MYPLVLYQSFLFMSADNVIYLTNTFGLFAIIINGITII